MSKDQLQYWKTEIDDLCADETVNTFEAFIRELLQKLVLAVDIEGEKRIALSQQEWDELLVYLYANIATQFSGIVLAEELAKIDTKNVVIGGDNLSQTWQYINTRVRNRNEM